MSKFAIAATLVLVLAMPAVAGTPEPGYSDTAYSTGLDQPTAIAFLPDGRMFITQKGGEILLRDTGGSVSTLVTIPVCTDAEMGLLGIALDPNFNSNGFVYLYRTKAGGGGCGTATGRFNQVVRVTFSGGSVAVGSLVELVTGIPTDQGNHDGGVVRLGPDNKLYVGVGDSGTGDNQGGPGSSTNPYSQDLGSLAGKVLRLELDGTAPPDNPFVSTVGAQPEIYALGLRNPFRMSFDPMTGKLWLADVGDSTNEEIDLIVSGGNYAFPHCEGLDPSGCQNPGDVDPIFTYPHAGGSSLGRCVIGGTFAGAAFGAFSGDYVFGDCVSSVIYRATLNGTRDDIVGTPVAISTSAATPSDFVAGPDGAIYYTAIGAGDVRRLALPATGSDALLTGRTIALRLNPTKPNVKSMRITSKDANTDLGGGNGSADDPTTAGGSLRLQSTSAGFDVTYPLPLGSWTLYGKPGQGKGYNYKDRFLANGPTTNVAIRNGKSISITGRSGALGHLLGSNPDPVNVVLTTGTKKYCMAFGGTTKFNPNKTFTAKDALAPGACPP